MFQPSYRVMLGILASILVVATALWGLFTYWPDRLSFAPSGGVSGARGWGTLLILTIGLAIGWATRWCIIGGRELPGGIWTTLVAGLLGAWLGGAFLGSWGLVWEGVNLIGSLIIAFALAWGGGQILACLRGKGRGRETVRPPFLPGYGDPCQDQRGGGDFWAEGANEHAKCEDG